MQFDALCTPELSVKGGTREGEARPLRCKRWSCPVCAQINRRRVIAIAAKACPRAMLTLTVSSVDYPDTADAAEALKRGLRLLRLRLQRHERLSNFQFIAVFEKHKSGAPHLHLLIRGKFIPWQKLRQWWEEITGSTHVDIRKIDTRGKAAFYVAKYIGKDLSAFPHCKRWWRSHGYSEDVIDDYAPDQRFGRPTRYLANIHRVRFAMLLEGWTVEKVGREGIRWRAPPDTPTTLDYVLSSAEGRTSAALLRRARM